MPRRVKPTIVDTPGNDDALAFLLSIQNNPAMPVDMRIRAAIAAAPYQHQKLGNAGLKHQRKGKAEAVSAGRFKPAEAPPLNGRGKVK